MNKKKNIIFSAKTGVIIVVGLTIILAGIIFIHVESIRDNQERVIYVEGIVKSVYTDFSIIDNDTKIDIWNVTIQDITKDNIDITYHMIMKLSLVPEIGEFIRVYYLPYSYEKWNFLDVYRIENQ